MPRLSPAAVRRIALAAQGFGAPQPDVVNLGHLRRTMRRLAVVQLDSVNVFSRSHYLPFFSRLGAYVRGGLRPRETVGVQAHLERCARCRAVTSSTWIIALRRAGLLPPREEQYHSPSHSAPSARR